MQGARSLRRASYIVSSVGILVTVIVLTIYFAAFYGSHDDDYCTHYDGGHCYRYLSSDITRDECLAIKGSVYVYGDGCYYD